MISCAKKDVILWKAGGLCLNTMGGYNARWSGVCGLLESGKGFLKSLFKHWNPWHVKLMGLLTVKMLWLPFSCRSHMLRLEHETQRFRELVRIIVQGDLAEISVHFSSHCRSPLPAFVFLAPVMVCPALMCFTWCNYFHSSCVFGSLVPLPVRLCFCARVPVVFPLSRCSVFDVSWYFCPHLYALPLVWFC